MPEKVELLITDGASFLGQTDSVYFSTNFGNSWTGISKSIGYDNYLSDIKEDKSGKLFFGTRRTGLYEIDIITSVNNDDNSVSKSFQLYQNYPNPFNPSTKIKYALPERAEVQIKVYDILGRVVTELVNESKQAGFYEATFNASNLSTGVYIYRIKAFNGERLLFSESKRMILMK